MHGTGEIRLEFADRAAGYFTTLSDGAGREHADGGVYLRADSEDLRILDGSDERQRVELIQRQLRLWKDVRGA